jgi:hypothetical protein
MTVSSLGGQVLGACQGSVNFLNSSCSEAGRVFTVLSEDVAEIETAIMFGKVLDVFISAKETLGFGVASSTDKAYQSALGCLDAWNAVMTFPGAIKASVEKVSEFFIKQTYLLAADCVGTLTGTFNAACDVVGFIENQLEVACFKGISDSLETSNFQALAVGATARTAIAAEKLFASVSAKKDYRGGIEGGLDVVKNLGDLTLAVAMLADGGKSVAVVASALSTASKVAQYSYSKLI